MSSFVFTSEKVLKKDWYTRVKQILIDNGWINVSSKPSVDFDIFYSDSMTGDKKMYFQMKEYDDTTSTSALSNSVARVLEVRLIKSYTPGTAGSAGTIPRNTTQAPYINNLIAGNNFPLLAEFTIHYHCNKNRLVLINEFPPSMDGEDGSCIFIGMSDDTFGKEVDYTAPIFMSNCAYTYGLQATDKVDQYGDSYSLTRYASVAPTGVSLNGIVFAHQIAYGTSTEGGRGYLDGVYIIKDGTGLLRGDKLIDENGYEYRIVIMNPPPTNYASVFPSGSNTIAIRVA